MSFIPLTQLQKKIMGEFYLIPATRVIYNKTERNALRRKAVAKSPELDFETLQLTCPALEHQIKRSYESGRNIQSAVFSECVYAQTFANMMGLPFFVNCYEDSEYIPDHVRRLLHSYHLVPRYVYSTFDKRRMLIQAGGCDGIDSALITVFDLVIYTIEFKEPGAKTSEPDLPKYKEDGVMVVTEKWLAAYPQFHAMLKEKDGLNFFAVMGNNIKSFSRDSIDIAVSNNYSGRKKYADVICTEDKNGYLVLLPTNQVPLWAEIEGEIRPAGRNHYKVWTPLALKRFLIQKGGILNGDRVMIPKQNLGLRKERGGNGRVSGYKITPLFFVYVEYCSEVDGILTFDINDVQQLNPTITAKMFFKNVLHKDVKAYYGL